MKKQYGGLGIPDIKDLNLCLLGSWVKRYFRDEGKLWRRVVEKKYCKKGNIFCSEKKHASLSGRRCSWRHRLLKWDTCGVWGRVIRLGFGKTLGLGLPHLLCSFGGYIACVMKKQRL
jgi:hypothetical protein